MRVRKKHILDCLYSVQDGDKTKACNLIIIAPALVGAIFILIF